MAVSKPVGDNPRKEERLPLPAVEERILTRERTMEEPMMTAAQRDELRRSAKKRTYRISRVNFSREKVRSISLDLKKRLTERK